MLEESTEHDYSIEFDTPSRSQTCLESYINPSCVRRCINLHSNSLGLLLAGGRWRLLRRQQDEDYQAKDGASDRELPHDAVRQAKISCSCASGFC